MDQKQKNQVKGIELALFKYDTERYHDFLDKKAVNPIEITIKKIFDEHNGSAKNMSTKTVSEKSEHSGKTDSKIICTADNYKSDNYIYCKDILNNNKHMLDEVNKNYEVLTKAVINEISTKNLKDKTDIYNSIYNRLTKYHSKVSDLKSKVSDLKTDLQNKTPEKKSVVTRIKNAITNNIPFQTKLSNKTKQIDELDELIKQIDELDELIKRIERILPFYSDNPSILITKEEIADFESQLRDYRNHPDETTYPSNVGGRKTRRKRNKRRKTIRHRRPSKK